MSARDRLQANNAGSRASLNGIGLCICKFNGGYSTCILVRPRSRGESSGAFLAGGVLSFHFFPLSLS